MSDEQPPPRERRRIPPWVLAGVLSLVVFACWAIYLKIAPVPLPVAEQPDAQPMPGVAAAASPEVHLLLWRNVIGPDILTGFQAETGIKVIVQSYDTNEQLNTLLGDGHLASDIAVASGPDVKRLIAAGLLGDLPPLAGRAALDPSTMARAAVYDAGNTHSAVVLWGTLGLAFDAAKTTEVLGAPVSDSWQMLFDPAIMAKLASCGVQVVDFPAGVFPIALIYLGRPSDTANAEDTDAASRLWEAVRPSISKFADADVADALASGKACFALATSGDAFRARVAAKAGGNAVDIHYLLPKEGAIVWYALIGISKTAQNPEAAAKLAEYLLRPDIAARLSNTEGLVNAVPASVSAVSAEFKNDPNYAPAPADFARFVPELEPSPAAMALRNRFWQLINTTQPSTPP